jgi:hypothetical protein
MPENLTALLLRANKLENKATAKARKMPHACEKNWQPKVASSVKRFLLNFHPDIEHVSVVSFILMV